jgi:predicted MFS family arabinose efflux permease
MARPDRNRWGALAGREFRLLFLGRVVSMLGNTLAPVALAFAVLRLTGSKTDLGIVLAARQVPQVIFLLFGGVLADRLPRHRVMLVSSLLSAASQGAVAVLLLAGDAQLWQLAALSAVNGSSSAFFFPASQGILPQTVRPSQLQEANALLRLGLNATAIVGPALGGAIVAVANPGWALAVDATTFLLGGLVIAAMRVPAGAREAAGNVFRELHDGWREFRARTWLWVIVLQFSLLNASQQAVRDVLGPVQAERHLGGAGPYGLIVASAAAGFVCGGVLMLRFRPERMLLVASVAILAEVIQPILFGFPAPVAALMAGGFVTGLGIEVFGVLWDTTMQQQIPGEKLSRVYAYDMLGSIALVPVGLAVVGPVADLVGVRATCWGAAVLIAAATVPVFFVREVRELRRSEPA